MSLILCAFLFAAAAPRVINHPPIPLKADAAAFAPSRTGCKGESGSYECKKGPIAELGCDSITLDDLLGALPSPTAHCWKYNSGPMLPAGEYIHGPRGLIQVYERLVVLDNGRYRLIKNMADFYRAAKPVTSEAQALSMAIAVTGEPPLYGLKIDPGFRYFASTIEDTYVTHGRNDDFIVHNLRSYRQFGCGPHTTSLLTVRVPRVGAVSEISTVKAFEDPKQDGLCVD
jgi:hypothetical protein